MMTKATVQSFCIANIVNIVYFNGKEVYPKSVTEKKESILFVYYPFFPNLKIEW